MIYIGSSSPAVQCSVDAQGEPEFDLVQVHRPSSLPPQQRRDTTPCIQACITCLYIALHRNHDDVTFVTNSHLDSFRLASLLEELCLVGSPVFVHALGKKHLLVFSFCQLMIIFAMTAFKLVVTLQSACVIEILTLHT